MKNLSEVSKDRVESYFRPFSEEARFNGIAEFNGKLKENCFYPTKDFYEKYPDTVRHYLNEDNLRDTYLRESQDYDIHEFLQSHNINSKSSALNTSDVREKFYLLEKLQRKKLEQLSRIGQISSSESGLKIFYE